MFPEGDVYLMSAVGGTSMSNVEQVAVAAFRSTTTGKTAPMKRRAEPVPLRLIAIFSDCGNPKPG